MKILLILLLCFPTTAFSYDYDPMGVRESQRNRHIDEYIEYQQFQQYNQRGHNQQNFLDKHRPNQAPRDRGSRGTNDPFENYYRSNPYSGQ